MQITKKQLKQIISEEMETVANEKDNLDTLLEGYAAGYEADEQTVSKEALMDFLSEKENKKAISVFIIVLLQGWLLKGIMLRTF